MDGDQVRLARAIKTCLVLMSGYISEANACREDALAHLVKLGITDPSVQLYLLDFASNGCKPEELASEITRHLAPVPPGS